jgi:hypothetical protein
MVLLCMVSSRLLSRNECEENLTLGTREYGDGHDQYHTRYFTDSGIIGSKGFESENYHRFKHLSIKFYTTQHAVFNNVLTHMQHFGILDAD